MSSIISIYRNSFVTFFLQRENFGRRNRGTAHWWCSSPSRGHQRQQVWKSKMRSFIVFLLNSMCSPQKESNGNSFLEVSLITAGFPRQVYSGPFNPMGNNFGGRRFPTKKKSGDCHCHATNIYCQGCHCLLNQSKPRWNTTPTSGKVKQCQTFHKAGKLRRKIKCPYGPY